LVISIEVVEGGETNSKGHIREPELQGGVINTGQIGSTAGLMLLRVESKGINVNTISGGVGVVLFGLNVVEVRTFALVKTIMTVQLNEGSSNGVERTINQETKVEGLIDANIIRRVGTSINELLNGEGQVTNSKVSAHVGTLDITVAVNMEVSIDLIGQVVARLGLDGKRASVNPQALVGTFIADKDLTILGRSAILRGERFPVTSARRLLTRGNNVRMTILINITDGSRKKNNGI